MVAINDAVVVVLAALEVDGPTPPSADETGSSDQPSAPATATPTTHAGVRHSDGQARGPSQWARDAPSFVIEALPVEAFEALLLVAATSGQVLDDDPPYRLDALVHLEVRHPELGDDAAVVEAWCRLDLVPDAGASTVSLTAAVDATALAPLAIAGPEIVDTVRDWWIRGLNQLDWPDSSTA